MIYLLDFEEGRNVELVDFCFFIKINNNLFVRKYMFFGFLLFFN